MCVRWVDSAEVYVLSNCAGPEVLQNVRRWDKAKGNFTPRPEPYVISVYQLLHGAIDKSDRRQNEVGFNHKASLNLNLSLSLSLNLNLSLSLSLSLNLSPASTLA